MRRSRERMTEAGAEATEVGLAALGSSGPWEISIDQSTSGPDRWFALLDGPLVYLRFEISSLEVIDQAIAFLSCSQENGDNIARAWRQGTCALGVGKASEARFVRDDEFSDRFFFVMESRGGALVRLTIGGDDLVHVLDALRQLSDDLSR